MEKNGKYICKDLLYGFDWSGFNSSSDLDRAKSITGALNYILAPSRQTEMESFAKEALLLHQALSLCSSIATYQERNDAAFFEAVRVLLSRVINQGHGHKFSLKEVNQRINELLKP